MVLIWVARRKENVRERNGFFVTDIDLLMGSKTLESNKHCRNLVNGMVCVKVHEFNDF
jgi:hypothetical protein